MNSILDENKYSITDSGWIMYESFSENLNSLSKKLPVSLFNKCWPALVYKLSTVSLWIVPIILLFIFLWNFTVYIQRCFDGKYI